MFADWSNIALAVAAMMGLVVVIVQFGFDMADHGSPSQPQEQRPREQGSRGYKKAA
jgi:hypothetical protein